MNKKKKVIMRFYLFIITCFLLIECVLAQTPATYQQNFFDSLYKDNEIVLKPEDFKEAGTLKQPNIKISDTLVYQVQFFTTQNKDIADKEKRLIEEILSVPVFIVFETPSYKLRAGKYIKKEQAEDLKNKMMDLGHSQSWILQVKK